LRDPNVRYRMHNSPQLLLILRQINLTQALPTYFFKIQFNIILIFLFKCSR